MYTSYISYILYIAGRVIPSKKIPPINIPFIAPGLHSAWKMQHYTKRCSLGRIQNIWICLFANICISCRDATIFGEEGIIGMQTVPKWDVTLAAARSFQFLSFSKKCHLSLQHLPKTIEDFSRLWTRWEVGLKLARGRLASLRSGTRASKWSTNPNQG